MSDTRLPNDLDRNLATYGSDLSRWPDRSVEAKAALLGNPEFRRAFERERDFDRKLAEERDKLDGEIARSGAVARLKHEALKWHSANFLAGMPWRRVAAGVLLAGMLGGGLDLMLPEPIADPLDVSIVDPLDDLDGAGTQ